MNRVRWKTLRETAAAHGFSPLEIDRYCNRPRALCERINANVQHVPAAATDYLQPTQLVLIGFGMVSRTLATIMLQTDSRFARLPIVIIEAKKIVGVAATSTNPGSSGHCHYDETSDEHEPESIHSEVFAKLMAANSNVTAVNVKLTRDNYQQVFAKYVKNGAIVVDLAVRLGTAQLVAECRRRHCVYVNTAIDTWKHTDESLFSLKQSILEQVREADDAAGSNEKQQQQMTAVFNHGMNPGLVSHFVKYLLRSLSSRGNDSRAKPQPYNEIARNLGLTLIQIAERDTQTSARLTTEKCFYNTWSVVGFVDEATLPTEISWGTHEAALPYHASKRARKASTQIILPIPGYQVRTRSYEPKGGSFTGYCIPHAEAYSIANYLRVGDTYNPSVYYSYLVPDTAKLIAHYLDYALNDQHLPKREHVLRSDEISGGYDSVGILAFFRRRPDEPLKKYWVGSIVSNDMARAISPEINGTCMQVAISVLACIEWMVANPHRGIVEPEEVDSDFVIDYCRDWLGEFFMANVTAECADIDSDQLSQLLAAPSHILFDE
jgi:homospermidine synthase